MIGCDVAMPGAARRRTPSDGFTLIEVVGALLIFALGVLVALNLAGSLAVQVRLSTLRSEVVTLAEERLEAMERLPYDSLVVGSTPESLTVQGLPYTRTTVIAPHATRTYSVEVTVEPSDPDLGPSQTLLSYVYDPW